MVDVVGVYTEEFKQVFSDAVIMKLNVVPEAEMMKQPLERGAIVIDHRIILPTTIELSLILRPETVKETYQTITRLYRDATSLIVQTKVSVFKNQIIQSPPHEENADMYDTIMIIIKLTEVQFAQTQTKLVPRKASYRPKVNRGQQQPQKEQTTAIRQLGKAATVI
jgi:hypothetical protein